MRDKWKNDMLRKGQALPSAQRLPFKQTLQEARPSLTHMAMKELMDRNILKFIISQNIDGLHMRSGVRSNQIAELHGNVYLEFCTSCGREYLRDFHVRGPKGSKHMTGRTCESNHCEGALKDTVINFGEKLTP